MRRTVLRRSAVAASAVSLALLATACGGGQESGDEGKGKTASEQPSASAPAAAKALTAAELEKAVLAQSDVKGHKVTPPGAGDIVEKKDVAVDNPACEVLAHTGAALPNGTPAATVQRKVVSEPEKPADTTSPDALAAAFDVTMTMVALSSYEAMGAEDVLDALTDAGDACAGGFTITTKGEKQKVTKVEKASITAGEDAAAWTVTSEQGGTAVVTTVTVVRQGSTLASFSSANLGALDKPSPLPKAVIDAQVAKLG
ncbi:hypothetical protein [Streptomyces formicae]|uniref:Lipoprotein n=1 Tax=Streptomyces formicae TaxID=1616117 RepID=A0ABY3WNB1_9ACTN|nr:hypothetical protein [Streptomyces formicae]UNM12006.1 hypothetical protein J4032_11050 [Streptomyces formicae]